MLGDRRLFFRLIGKASTERYKYGTNPLSTDHREVIRAVAGRVVFENQTSSPLFLHLLSTRRLRLSVCNCSHEDIPTILMLDGDSFTVEKRLLYLRQSKEESSKTCLCIDFALKHQMKFIFLSSAGGFSVRKFPAAGFH